MGTSKDILLNEIDELKIQLAAAKKHHYVYDTHSLHCSDGELYMYHSGVKDKERCLVINVEQLFKDLPFIVSQVTKENAKMQEMYLNSLKESLKEL